MPKLSAEESLEFSYNKKEQQLHYTESADTIEVRLMSRLKGNESLEQEIAIMSAAELKAVIDKTTHRIDSDTVTIRIAPKE